MPILFCLTVNINSLELGSMNFKKVTLLRAAIILQIDGEGNTADNGAVLGYFLLIS